MSFSNTNLNSSTGGTSGQSPLPTSRTTQANNNSMQDGIKIQELKDLLLALQTSANLKVLMLKEGSGLLFANKLDLEDNLQRIIVLVKIGRENVDNSSRKVDKYAAYVSEDNQDGSDLSSSILKHPEDGRDIIVKSEDIRTFSAETYDQAFSCANIDSISLHEPAGKEGTSEIHGQAHSQKKVQTESNASPASSSNEIAGLLKDIGEAEDENVKLDVELEHQKEKKDNFDEEIKSEKQQKDIRTAFTEDARQGPPQTQK